MPNVQFKSSKVLFKGGQVTFCPADCTCTDDNPTPPVVIPPSCGACKSPSPCAHYIARACTPRRLKLVLTEPTYQTTCLLCADGKSIKKVSGSIAGTYTLEQDPRSSCRWVFTDNSPTLVITGYTSADCTTGSTTANRLDFEVTQTADGFSLLVIARFNNIKDAEFIVFSATVTGLMDFVNANVLAGDTAFTVECRDYLERGGGRLAIAGTATITLCPALPDICHCTDAPPCVTVQPVMIPPGIADFVYDSSATATSVHCDRTNVCEWRSPTVAAGGVSNLQLKVKWYDAAQPQATQGCGYYLYVYAFDGVDLIDKGIYFHKGEDAGGVYELFEDFDEPGLQFTLEVVLGCDMSPFVPADCASAGVQPVVVTVGGEFNEVDTGDCIEGIPTPPVWDGGMTLDPLICVWSAPADSVGFSNGRVLFSAVIVLTSSGGIPYWEFTIVQRCPPSSTSLRWIGRKYVGSTPAGTYARDDSSPSESPAFITIT